MSISRKPGLSLKSVGLLFLGAAALVSASAARAEDSGKNVILIGWDAAQRNHVKELLAANELPTLAALAKEGAMVDIDVISGATDTKTGWTQINTGYAPDKTGVYSNGRYQPIPEGYTMEERVEKALGKDNVVTRAVIGKKGHVDNDPPQKAPYEKYQARQKKQKKVEAAAPGKSELITGGDKVVEENGQKFVVTPGKPWFNACKNFDSWENGLIENSKVGEKVLGYLDQDKGERFLYFVHFASPDHEGHKNGENSQEYSNGIKSDDEWTGKILARLKELGLDDKTLIYVTADHGFNEGEKGHSYAPWVFLATNDKAVNRNGCREDIAPTILERFGVDLASLNPKLDGYPLDQPAPERKAPAQKPGAPAGGKAGKKGQAPSEGAQAKAAEAKLAPAPSDSGSGAAASKSKAGRKKGGKGAE
ncbi:MAG: alkaline phosphatase family protein [Candidatus Sumerlaeota bacterium]|nr:alkaline phosphatase family protein [Candidatus Sumerlaeota bacterium]